METVSKPGTLPQAKTGRPRAAAAQAAVAAATVASTPPPVVIYLPGLPTGNSGKDLAKALADDAGQGPGKFTVETVAVPSKRLADCSRIVKDGKTPVLDVCTLDYRPGLRLAEITGSGTGAAVRRFAAALRTFVRAASLLLPARKRAKAKGGTAKFQLFLGLLAVLVLLLSVLITGFAVLVSIGLLREPAPINGSLADAIAIGATALSVYLLVRVRPAVRESSRVLEELLEYVNDQRRAASVGRTLGPALDDLLESPHPRETIHIVGYSLGSLVAIDYLFPPSSLHMIPDERLKAVTSLVTVGCPLDLVRLYLPNFAENRDERVSALAWTNIFIPADVLGSNFLDNADKEVRDAGTPAGALGPSKKRPTSLRYTDVELTFGNAWTRTGFRTHSQYWRTETQHGCSALVAGAIGLC